MAWFRSPHRPKNAAAQSNRKAFRLEKLSKLPIQAANCSLNCKLIMQIALPTRVESSWRDCNERFVDSDMKCEHSNFNINFHPSLLDSKSLLQSPRHWAISKYKLSGCLNRILRLCNSNRGKSFPARKRSGSTSFSSNCFLIAARLELIRFLRNRVLLI